MTQEGVSKFQLHWTATAPCAHPNLPVLQRWRDHFYLEGLIGADPQRYAGIGFGNISCRSDRGFIVTATQTGHLSTLSAENFCEVTGWDILRNQLQAEGPQPPSSEALSHAACYDANADIQWVFHVHSAELWQHSAALGIAATPLESEYGTPAMAQAVAEISQRAHSPFLIQMAGHEDGIIAAGKTADKTGSLLLDAVMVAQLSSAFRK